MAALNTVYLALTMSLYCLRYGSSEHTCPKGHRLEGAHTCIQCEPGINYIRDEDHTFSTCYNCTRVSYPEVEILVNECDTSRDAQILCRPGYYRHAARNDRENNRCERCSSCENIARVCEGHFDAICCPANQGSIRVSNNVFMCHKKQTMCGRGQYMNDSTKECLACPDDTFMYESLHANTGCVKCAALSQPTTFHSTIVQECNATSPTVFGCMDGYFRDGLRESLMVEVKCSSCQKCLREVRQCDMLHDAICYTEDYRTQEMADDLDHVTRSKDELVEVTTLSGTQTVPECEEPSSKAHSLSRNPPGSPTPTQGTSSSSTTTTLPLICHTVLAKSHHQHSEFRAYSIILFSLAVLVDMLYVFLYSRNFLKKHNIRFSRRNSTGAGKMSRAIGTCGVNLHCVFIFMHLFGVLCEVGVIVMDEGTLWTFTIVVGSTTLLLHFADALLFIFVKRVLSLKDCSFYRNPRNVSDNTNVNFGETRVIINSTDV